MAWIGERVMGSAAQVPQDVSEGFPVGDARPLKELGQSADRKSDIGPSSGAEIAEGSHGTAKVDTKRVEAVDLCGSCLVKLTVGHKRGGSRATGLHAVEVEESGVGTE
jgi:hypothetical protein